MITYDVLRRKWPVLLIGAVVFVVCGVTFLWKGWRAVQMWMEDGPFKGTKAVSAASGAPSSSMALGSHLTLESYDATTTATSALVQMRHDTKGVIWAINADADRVGDTRRVEFTSERHGPMGYKVMGVTEWTYGTESTWWYIDADGDLECFYNSW